MSSWSGPYAKACARLAASGFQLHWQSAPVGKCVKESGRTKPNSLCAMWVNALAKPDALLLRGVGLAEHKQLQVMLAELREAA
jgi:hypothetical protein